MNKGIVTKLVAGLALPCVLILAVACSEQSTPFAPDDSPGLISTSGQPHSNGLNTDDVSAISSELDFSGVISSIDSSAGTLTVTTRTEMITVDANSVIFRMLNVSGDDGNPNVVAGKIIPGGPGNDHVNLRAEAIAFSDLKVGDDVAVNANSVDANTLYAVAIEQEHTKSASANEVEFSDIIIFLDVNTREILFGFEMISGVVAPDADLRDTANVAVTLNDFIVCGPVLVRGEIQPDSSIVVNRMVMESFF
jgi:hypothetical protein